MAPDEELPRHVVALVEDALLSVPTDVDPEDWVAYAATAVVQLLRAHRLVLPVGWMTNEQIIRVRELAAAAGDADDATSSGGLLAQLIEELMKPRVGAPPFPISA